MYVHGMLVHEGSMVIPPVCGEQEEENNQEEGNSQKKEKRVICCNVLTSYGPSHEFERRYKQCTDLETFGTNY
jgi:hypothetical protein